MIFQLVSMGIKNFETGVLVQKFDRGSANCVNFFSQKRLLTRRPLSLEHFTQTKFAKKCFYNTKEMHYDYRTKFSRKIQSSKKHFSRKLIFRTFCCNFAVITLGEKGLGFSEKILHFWFKKIFENSILLKFCDYFNFFQKQANLQYARSEYMISLRYHEHERKRNENGLFTKTCLHHFSKTILFVQHWT